MAVISAGSVLDFGGGTEWAPPTVAIVNAANCGGLGGGGVDGAITSAGGPQLAADRRALPILEGTHMDRIVTGGAVLTGPGNYGRLHAAHVIHAVGPNYLVLAGIGKSMEDGDQQLREAYQSTMHLCLDLVEYVDCRISQCRSDLQRRIVCVGVMQQ
jgi:O-acetyl-ADP-ribose deacetylase (regulator of RNase III)